MGDELNISLYRLDAGLAELVDYFNERMADQENPPDAEEQQALHNEIRKYMEALPKKVDGVAGWFRAKGAQLDAILGPKTPNGSRKGGEVGRLRAMAESIERDMDRLKGIIAEILERQPMPAKGCRKLVGATGSQLLLKGNGGLQPLLIDEQILPDEYFDVVVRMPLEMWNQVLRTYDKSHAALISEEPSNARIREKLEGACSICGGTGEISDMNAPNLSGEQPTTDCTACGGTGKQGVPGASLAPRGSHVEVK